MSKSSDLFIFCNFFCVGGFRSWRGGRGRHESAKVNHACGAKKDTVTDTARRHWHEGKGRTREVSAAMWYRAEARARKDEEAMRLRMEAREEEGYAAIGIRMEAMEGGRSTGTKGRHGYCIK